VSAGEGEVRVFAQYDADFTLEADAVVVGSGPGGAVAAKELAEAGHRVVLLEEGPPFTPADFALDGALSMARTMRESGLRSTVGTVMPTMQAICLGGGSLVNSAICVRIPDFVLDEWCERHELRQTTRADLEPHYDAVGAFLGIARTPESVLGRRNLLFREGCCFARAVTAWATAASPSSATCGAVAAAGSASRAVARAPSSRWTSATCRRPCAPEPGCSPRFGWSRC
jgi:choline dehydrogenase-like flavoprotein